MRRNIGQIATAPSGADFISRLFDEVVEAIRRVGREPSEEFIKSSKAMFAQKNSQMTSSMYRDLEKGQQVERAQIIDDLIARYLQVELTMPLLNLVSTHLTIYESKL